MRALTVAVISSMVVLFPKVGNAQAYAYGTPAPEASAATAGWQAASEPIVVNGLVYFPTRAFRMFDAQVMMQTGIYDRVPVYADLTLEPFSIVYVPVSASSMRVYERRREGLLAGTTGSRTPSFPVEIASDTVLANTERANLLRVMASAGLPSPSSMSVGTTGSAVGLSPASDAVAIGDRPRPQHTRIESIPRPEPGSGVWLEFNGARWYADGSAVPFTPDRFEPIGDYRGFLVYRDKRRDKDEIWVSVVKDGPVAPYAKR